MSDKARSEKEAKELRNSAEQMAQWLIVNPVVQLFEGNVDSNRLMHELQVYQIELEMQNAELRHARAESDALLKQLSLLTERMEKSVLDSAASKETVEAIKVIAEMSQQIRRSGLNAEQTECLDKIDKANLHLLDIIKAVSK